MTDPPRLHSAVFDERSNVPSQQMPHGIKTINPDLNTIKFQKNVTLNTQWPTLQTQPQQLRLDITDVRQVYLPWPRPIWHPGIQ